MSEVRNDWTRDEIAELFDLPFMELVFRAAEVHRANHPHNQVQLSTLLSIKTGGCPEDFRPGKPAPCRMDQSRKPSVHAGFKAHH